MDLKKMFYPKGLFYYKILIKIRDSELIKKKKEIWKLYEGRLGKISPIIFDMYGDKLDEVIPDGLSHSVEYAFRFAISSAVEILEEYPGFEHTIRTYSPSFDYYDDIWILRADFFLEIKKSSNQEFIRMIEELNSMVDIFRDSFLEAGIDVSILGLDYEKMGTFKLIDKSKDNG